MQDADADIRPGQGNPNFTQLGHNPPPPNMPRQETLIDINQGIAAGPGPRMIHTWPTRVYGPRNEMTSATLSTFENHVLEVRKLLMRAKNVCLILFYYN